MDNTEDSVPSLARLQHWNNQWDTKDLFDNYRAQEAALEWLFKTYPTNTDLNQVLIKVAALDVFYSTRIYHPTETAQHICKLKDFDERVKAGDLSLVTDVAVFTVKLKHDIKRKNIVTKKKGEDLKKNIFSFASKYCSWHNPEAYPIYDSKVKEKLKVFKTHLKSGLTYKKGDLNTYEGFCKAITEVRDKFCLGPSMKQIDRYLWTWAKDDDDKANKAKTSS